MFGRRTSGTNQRKGPGARLRRLFLLNDGYGARYVGLGEIGDLNRHGGYDRGRTDYPMQTLATQGITIMPIVYIAQQVSSSGK